MKIIKHRPGRGTDMAEKNWPRASELLNHAWCPDKSFSVLRRTESFRPPGWHSCFTTCVSKGPRRHRWVAVPSSFISAFIFLQYNLSLTPSTQAAWGFYIENHFKDVWAANFMVILCIIFLGAKGKLQWWKSKFLDRLVSRHFWACDAFWVLH